MTYHDRTEDKDHIVLCSTDTPETCELADLARTKYTENSILKTLKHVNANYPVFGDKYQYKGSLSGVVRNSNIE